MNQTNKYYELGKDSTYCVHFSNKHGLSVDAIREIFSEWGNVVGVTKAGDDYGYRFVRYKNEDEAKRCVEATRNHPTVRVLPKRPKQQNTEQNSGYKNTNNTNNNQQETQTPWGSTVSQNCDESNLKKTASRNKDNSTDEKLFADTNAKSPKKVEILDDNSMKEENPIHFKNGYENLFSRLGTTNRRNNSESKYKKDSSGENLCSYKVDSSTKNEHTSTTSNDIVCSVNKAIPTNSIFPLPSEEILDEIPNLVMAGFVRGQEQFCNSSYNRNSVSITSMMTERIADAEQVVVANIPKDCSENLILHLFRSYEPICIYPMKILSFLAIRYCIVYFSSALCAKGVESQFDNFKLGEKNLIVLRPRV